MFGQTAGRMRVLCTLNAKQKQACAMHCNRTRWCSTCRLAPFSMSAACWLVSSLGDVRVPLVPGSEGDRCGDSPICKGVTPLHREAVFLTSCATRIANSQNGLGSCHACRAHSSPVPALSKREHDMCTLAILTPDSERALSRRSLHTQVKEKLQGPLAGRQLTLSKKLSVYPGTVSPQNICTIYVYLTGKQSTI